MLSLDAEAVAALPVDRLGLAVLADFVATAGWNERNYVLEARAHGGYSGESVQAIVEALAWLRARGLTAHDPSENATDKVFVTRRGHQALEEGADDFYASERVQQGLHPMIEQKARPQFLIGEYELGVFSAMKAIEVRVREIARFGDDVHGVDLLNKALGPGGPLTDPGQQRGEQEGTRALFAGAYAVFRNPAGHREVNYDDVAEAAEAVQTASALMRILDRVDKRLNP